MLVRGMEESVGGWLSCPPLLYISVLFTYLVYSLLPSLTAQSHLDRLVHQAGRHDDAVHFFYGSSQAGGNFRRHVFRLASWIRIRFEFSFLFLFFAARGNG